MPHWLLARNSKHRRMPRLEYFAAAQIHVHTARQAGIEAAHRSHDVDSLEVGGSVLLKDRRVLDGILVRTGRAVDVSGAAVPGSRRIRMIVGDLAVANDDVVEEHAAYSFVETTADRITGDHKFGPSFRVAGAYFIQC